MLVLHMGALKLRIGQSREQHDGNRQAPKRHVDRIVIQPQTVPQRDNRPIGRQGRPRPHRHDPPQHNRRAGLVDPLQLQRLVHRLEIVKPDGGQKRHHQKATERGEPPREHRRRPQERQHHKRQNLLAHRQKDRDDDDRQQPRNLPHRMQPADLLAGERGHLDDEVVQKRRPGRETERHRRSHEVEKRLRPPPDGQAGGLGQGHGVGHGTDLAKTRADANPNLVPRTIVPPSLSPGIKARTRRRAAPDRPLGRALLHRQPAEPRWEGLPHKPPRTTVAAPTRRSGAALCWCG